MQNTTFIINEEGKQFELQTKEGTAVLEFYREADKIYLTHTQTPEDMRGKGYAAELVKQTLQSIKNNGLTAVPSCSYVAHYVNEHPEWRSVLSEGYQM